MTAPVGNGDDGNERELVFNRLNHDDAENIVAGAPADGELGALADLVAELRGSSAIRVPESTAAAQIAAAASAARGAPVTPTEAPRRRRSGVLVSAPARALAAALVTLTIGVGTAAAGWLPDPVQRAVATAGDSVGLNFPHPGERRGTSATTIPDDGVAPVATSSPTSTTSTTAPEPTSTTSTTIGEGDEGPPAALVGAHVWSGTSCDDSPIEIRYEVTQDGTLLLTSTSDPGADVEVRADRIEVEFADGVAVRIELDEHDWTISEHEDRSCADDQPDTDDGDGDDDTETDAEGGSSGSGGEG